MPRYDDKDDDADLDIRRRSRSGNSGGSDNDLAGSDIALAIICSGIGCIMGIVYAIQGKPKGGKMIGLSFLFIVIWNIIAFVIRSAG